MDRKSLMGVSICAVVLLVMGSLSNVVGYQSVKSTVSDSPLFQTRTQRATNQQQNIITSQYLGMGKENLLQFPMRDNKTDSLIKAIEFINKMNDETFKQFIELCFQNARQDTTLREIKPDIILQTLYLLRTYPDTIINSFIRRNNQNITSSNMYSVCHWFPGCIPVSILIILIAFIFILPYVLKYLAIMEISMMQSCLHTCDDGRTFCGNRCLNK